MATSRVSVNGSIVEIPDDKGHVVQAFCRTVGRPLKSKAELQQLLAASDNRKALQGFTEAALTENVMPDMLVQATAGGSMQLRFVTA